LDAVTDSLDVIVQPFGFPIAKIPGYGGAAILGDGAVAPVLDLPALLLASAADSNHRPAELEPLPAPPTLPSVLVVDDSLSQRRALEQLLRDAGFQVETARDGVEAAEHLAGNQPDIVLTDLEMPRMNGIELTAHIRGREHLKSLPVVMITSRTTQTHRQLAENAGVDCYLVKPVREDDLLDRIYGLINASGYAGANPAYKI